MPCEIHQDGKPISICDQCEKAFTDVLLKFQSENAELRRKLEEAERLAHRAKMNLVAPQVADDLRRYKDKCDALAAALRNFTDLNSKVGGAGWRWGGGSDNNKYYCEYCHESDQDLYNVQHSTSCPVTIARTALAGIPAPSTEGKNG